MNETQQIIERGWWTVLVAPETTPQDRETRLAQVESVLMALAPVFRPLALEVELCWRELDTGLPAPIFPEPPIRLLVLDGAQSRVAVRPSVAAPPPPVLVPRLDHDAIAACLKNGEPPDSNLVLDWLAIRSLAAAVRAFEPLKTITLEQLGRSIPAYEPDWFAGPVGDRSFEVWPPAELDLRAEGRVRLRLIVYWSGWLRQGSRERGAIEAAMSLLQASGWMAELTPLGT
jgi:hypothetical protein